MWLRENPRMHLTCIDPYSHYHSRRSQDDQDASFKIAVEAIKPYNAEIIRAGSLDVVDTFQNKSIDFLYIDGNHEFDHVMQDMIRWIPKVKERGIIAIHDYCAFWWGGVIQAVNAFTSAHHVDPWYITSDYKPTAFWEKQAARAK
jgi:hypothetical protein